MSFDVVVIAQRGRWSYEALLFAASLRSADPEFSGRLIVAEPRNGPEWPHNPGIGDSDLRAELLRLGAEIRPFRSRFGAAYPQANKADALAAIEAGRPFLLFDSDSLVLGPLGHLHDALKRPCASLRRENTWPVEELYGPRRGAIWESLYDRFDLDIRASVDPGVPAGHWEHFLYLSAAWVAGPDARRFGRLWGDRMEAIRRNPGPTLIGQSLDPWLDQVALPLVLTELGGGRPSRELVGLDGPLVCHWRVLPLAYARETDETIETLERIAAPNRIKKILKRNEAMLRMIYQGRGRKVRALFDREALPPREAAIRRRIREAGHWIR